MDVMNKQVYGYLSNNTYGVLSQLFSDTLLSNVTPEFTTKFMPQIQKVIKGRAFRIYDQFYIKNAKKSDTTIIKSGKGAAAYTMDFIAPEKENYISMLIAGDTLNEVMLTLMYIKENGKWKLSSLVGEDYSLNSLDAIQQYNYARTLLEKGDLIDAVNVMALANHCLHTGGNIFSYENAAKIIRFGDSLTAVTKARYVFPYTVNELPGKPSVFNIHYEVMDHHFTPMIMYLTSINVSDTVALKAENQIFQKNIGTIFQGMDKNNRTLLYRAFNEHPDEKTSPKYFGYIQHLN